MTTLEWIKVVEKQEKRGVREIDRYPVPPEGEITDKAKVLMQASGVDGAPPREFRLLKRKPPMLAMLMPALKEFSSFKPDKYWPVVESKAGKAWTEKRPLSARRYSTVYVFEHLVGDTRWLSDRIKVVRMVSGDRRGPQLEAGVPGLINVGFKGKATTNVLVSVDPRVHFELLGAEDCLERAAEEMAEDVFDAHLGSPNQLSGKGVILEWLSGTWWETLREGRDYLASVGIADDPSAEVRVPDDPMLQTVVALVQYFGSNSLTTFAEKVPDQLKRELPVAERVTHFGLAGSNQPMEVVTLNSGESIALEMDLDLAKEGTTTMWIRARDVDTGVVEDLDPFRIIVNGSGVILEPVGFEE